MGSIINISGTFSPPTHVPDCLMGMARIYSEPFLFNPKEIVLKLSILRVPATGKLKKQSPRVPYSLNFAPQNLGRNPGALFFIFPASHSIESFKAFSVI